MVCHNPTLPATTDNVTGLQAGSYNFGPLVHRIHGDNTLTNKVFSTTVNFNEVTYPQSIHNCKTCHKGTDNFWQTRPTAESCGSCHTSVNFTTGANHLGGPQPTDQFCALCHPASGPGDSVTNSHATEVSTFNNPQLTPGLSSFQYGVDTVTVDNANHPVVKFWIKQAVADANGVVGAYSFFTLPTDNTGKVTQPAGFTGSPGFLLAFAMPQDGVSTPADYNNLGAGGNAPATGRAGQPQSINIVGQTVTGTSTQYTMTLTTGIFPAGSKLRAIAMQGAFVQIHANGPPALDNVELAVPSVVKAVTGDTVRRVIVKSGYNATTGAPEGCLECHEFFVGHGGSRNNNVQVCVVCHNPNLTTSGRTIVAVPPVVINPAIVNLDPTTPGLPANFNGNDPLTYPEVTDNFKSLIHGFHASGDDPLTFPERVRPDLPVHRHPQPRGNAGDDRRPSQWVRGDLSWEPETLHEVPLRTDGAHRGHHSPGICREQLQGQSAGQRAEHDHQDHHGEPGRERGPDHRGPQYRAEFHRPDGQPARVGVRLLPRLSQPGEPHDPERRRRQCNARGRESDPAGHGAGSAGYAVGTRLGTNL